MIDLSWRIYPAACLMAAGAWLVAAGIRRDWTAHRLRATDRAKPLTMVRGFRLMLLGVSVLALGAAWAWHLGWLAILALIFGGEEMLETSLVIFGLTRGATVRLRP